MAKAKEGQRLCKCKCGGWVRGVQEFERLWTWCETCTPVVTIRVGNSQVSGGE